MKQTFSLDMIHTQFKRKYKSFTYEETDIIDWAGDAIASMGIGKLRPTEKVVFLDVVNNHVDLPSFTHQIVQIAKDNRYNVSQKENKTIRPYTVTSKAPCSCDVVKEVQLHTPDCHNQPVSVNKEGDIIEGFEAAYYRPFYDLHYLHNDWRQDKHYANFTPVRLSNHVFFNTLVCQEDNHIVNSCAGDEYTIVGDDRLRFSFKEGRIAISLLQHPLDDNGWPMIEGDQDALKAVEYYILLQLCESMYYDGHEGYERKMHDARREWDVYSGRATSNMLMPNGVDEWQNLLDQNVQMLPKQNRYDNFFGTLNKRETKRFNMRGGHYGN